ncbi:MAG: hypothetical protein AUJ96_17650 [Armatimonadetes bacterium CG2_30_66_41]|nr:SUMF1/EgtB/PvdO family nonheme iron enzyme [Armatimonadota bacterium]OIP01200.1 MAG: hypothetical protein AUJ96_17650 [Armatimonadetes bacterium CG2_30_66_41]PIU91314.1 MAG: hypothetical protein COS65_22350 [Armatimonadetes bacterium CG06_land_8_20_14_3_00_66_21]PIX42957.1 MAG: hypothetical protein COZ57_20325 [Armatimonadetes bacterium CG_4_8_14_3_um_filter_66_20]PJB66765.1 MAG: hypothetical protein CO096_16750 [Armatimonadetes bacterium CG_4_9_14_3_um_filter_66_14]
MQTHPSSRHAVAALVLLSVLGKAAMADRFIIGAHTFDRGNVNVSLPGQQYAGKFPCVWNGGKVPDRAEYDIEFPVSAEYTLVALYTANDSRPVDLYLDDKPVATGFAGTTGDWNTDSAQWEKQCTLQIAKGKHTLALQRPECFPHICAFALESSVSFPEGWKPPARKGPDFDWRAKTAQFTLSAPDFDRGNVQTSLPGDGYARQYPCIWNAGEYPNRAEYELEFPVTADYTVSALYTADASRPVDLLLDGKKIHTGLASVTGSWQTDSAKWETQCTVPLTQGKHTLALQCQDCMPHICAVRLESSVPFPGGWYLKRPGLEERRKREEKQARLKAGLAALELINGPAMRRAVADLTGSLPVGDPVRKQAATRLTWLEQRKAEVRQTLEQGDEGGLEGVLELQAEQRRLLLANPVIDFDRLLLIKRGVRSPSLGLPQNWQSNCVLPRSGFDDEIAMLSLDRLEADPVRLYRPPTPVFVGDVDLNFDADKLLFSSIGTHHCWQVFEIGIDGAGLRQVTPGLYDDVDDYDACYLPDGRILFGSTRAFVSVPCVNGSTRVSNLFLMDPNGANVRQLCFDQEHNWCPTVLNDGRVLYARWEYTDTPHTHNRLLFQMNPDGTEQKEYYGASSYWPNSLFYARPIPGHPTEVVTVISGHHGVPRMGELVILDPAKGRHEADGVVQRIPGYGKRVEPLIEDQLVDNSWPKFLHPWPLSDKYFLTACQPSPTSLWGLYLVDVFDNIVLLKELPGYALFEPVPIRKRARPPAIRDRVNLKRNDCLVQMTDIYAGPGLAGIPRGTVKKLRLFTYDYDYPGMGGPQGVVGMEGPWDVRRILGTVPVEADGSAVFRAPANTPIALQPLDQDGAALQLMRSWFTGMPGEVLSCIGCHEQQDDAAPNALVAASTRQPREIDPWRGPARGYSFPAEVQPVIDKYCLACHNGQPLPNDATLLDLRGTEFIHDYDSRYHFGGQDAGKFSVGYANLQRFVRRPGLESDLHVLTPMDFHVSTTQLYQMLRKGHHGVALDEEAWDRLITWIDLNAPYHGSWVTIAGEEHEAPMAQRRREMLKLYGGGAQEWADSPLRKVALKEPEAGPRRPVSLIAPTPATALAPPPVVAHTPQEVRTLNLGGGITLSLAFVPAGEFVMGSAGGFPDEAPQARVSVGGFWMGQLELTNEQYAQFDPRHDSRVEVRHAMQFGVQGWPLNRPKQPVVRVSWKRALAFCKWLSDRTGQRFTLPTEAEWEYACRAGAATPFAFGEVDGDFSKFANLADMKLRDAVSHPYMKENVPLANPSKYDDWIPRDNRFNDGELVSADVGNYQPNAWGLYDMHGNVWEWTLSAAKPYPYRADDGRNEPNSAEGRIARGGSWRDRPSHATASVRLAYRPYQCVYNVGFRVVCAAE